MTQLRTVVCAALLAATTAAGAQEKKPDFVFAFHGFVGGSLYMQDAVMNANGQNAWFVRAQPNQDRLQLSGDVRQTRFNFSLAGPSVMGGATPKAVVEFDLFGGQAANSPANGGANNVTSSFGDSSVSPRLRIAYAELGWQNSTVRVGQDHQLILGIILPATVGHVANPLTACAGTIGWRAAGATFFQNVPATSAIRLSSM